MNVTQSLCRIVLVALAASALAVPAQANYVSTVLADNPLVYYRMQEATAPHVSAAVDSSGNNADGLYLWAFGGPGSITSTPGATAELDPGKQFTPAFNVGQNTDTGAFVAVPAITGGSLNAFSIEFMFKPDATTFNSNGLRAIYATDGGFALGDVHLNISPTTNIELAVSGAATAPSINLAAIAPVGEWSHVVVTYETSVAGHTVKFFVDGQLINGPSGSSGLNDQPANFDVASSIATWNSTRFFSGALDEFAIYGSALSDVQVAAHFAAIPEPSSLALLAFGAISMFLFRRNKK